MRYRGCVAVLLLLLVLAGCGQGTDRGPIDNVNDLEGRRVGVNLAWEADYLLTGREDMELYRYDSTADMLMALNYGKLDAIAVDDTSLRLVLSQVTGLEVVEPALDHSGYCIFLLGELADLGEDFNAFVADFRSRDSYETYCRRQAEFDGENYEAPDLPPDGDGRSLRVACVEDGYPRSFFDMRTGEALGFDVEVLRQWAGERGYHLDFTATNYDDMALGLQSGRYDIGVGYISSLYREEADKIGLFTSDSFVEIPTHFCQKGAGDISINGEVD